MSLRADVSRLFIVCLGFAFASALCECVYVSLCVCLCVCFSPSKRISQIVRFRFRCKQATTSRLYPFVVQLLFLGERNDFAYFESVGLVMHRYVIAFECGSSGECNMVPRSFNALNKQTRIHSHAHAKCKNSKTRRFSYFSCISSNWETNDWHLTNSLPYASNIHSRYK